ncbi:hypothetical protein [Streptomyces sp. NPDC006368]|uniref:hypothetical protein n=1 Tax=Streptomyces sp. NPDC006368 TaxID=3156760 RepID=UPI0033A6E7F1
MTGPVADVVLREVRRPDPVLEKCGFTVVGHDRGFAGAPGEETDEVVLPPRG